MTGANLKGSCVFCDKVMSRAGLTRHLQSCSRRAVQIAEADAKNGKTMNNFLLLVKVRWRPHWLLLELQGESTLADLDDYLRSIWLECCGHMSQFYMGSRRGDEIPFDATAEKLLKTGMELTHLYDFGTTSETFLQVKGVRTGKPLTKYPVFLIARNQLPEEECMQCESRAVKLCFSCAWDGYSGFLCAKHAQNHDCESGLVAIINSPRLGLCGYDGPGKAPY